MKKQYMKPDMKVVKLQHQCIICTSDPVRSVDGGDTGIGYSGGGSGPARARQHDGIDRDDWDDWDDWDE